MQYRKLAVYAASAILLLASSPADGRIRHEFNPKKTKLVAIMSPTTDYASSLVNRAKRKYVDRLEFAMNGTFFDPGLKKSGGKIISEGINLTYGINESGTALIYSDYLGGTLDMEDPDKLKHTPSFLADIFVPLFPEYKAGGRNLDRRRTARPIIAIENNGNGLIVYDNFTPSEARAFARNHLFKKAALGDGGNSAMYYDGKRHQYLLYPHRKLKSIIAGVKKRPPKHVKPPVPAHAHKKGSIADYFISRYDFLESK